MGNLRNDETCSLVCWEWLHLVRHQRFAVLLLQQKDLNHLRSCPELLKSPLSTIVPVVKELHIVSKSSIDFKDDMHNLPPFFHLKLFRLRMMTSLQWDDRCDPIDIPDAIFDPHSFKKTLTTLAIIFDFESFSHMLKFICAFACLETLDLEGDWPEDEAIPDEQYHPSHLLRTLVLRMHVSIVIESWLLGLDPVPQIETLAVRSEMHQSYRSLGRFLAAQGESLKHFVLSEHGPITLKSIESFQEQVNLKLNTNLKSLHLVGPWDAASEPWRAEFYKEVITQGLSPALRKILIHFSCHAGPEPLSLLDQHISRLAQSSLESVVLQFPNIHSINWDLDPGSEAKIREWFRECNARSILSIEPTPDISAADDALSHCLIPPPFP